MNEVDYNTNVILIHNFLSIFLSFPNPNMRSFKQFGICLVFILIFLLSWVLDFSNVCFLEATQVENIFTYFLSCILNDAVVEDEIQS